MGRKNGRGNICGRGVAGLVSRRGDVEGRAGAWLRAERRAWRARAGRLGIACVRWRRMLIPSPVSLSKEELRLSFGARHGIGVRTKTGSQEEQILPPSRSFSAVAAALSYPLVSSERRVAYPEAN